MDIPGFDIRYTYVTDISYLRQWIRSPGILKWFPMSEEERSRRCPPMLDWLLPVELQHHCNSQSYSVRDGDAFSDALQKSGASLPLQGHCRSSLQKKGIGNALIKNLKHLAKTYFHLEMISTEIFEGNPIVSVLKKNDFQEIFRQEKFVKTPDGYKARIFLETKL